MDLRALVVALALGCTPHAEVCDYHPHFRECWPTEESLWGAGGDLVVAPPCPGARPELGPIDPPADVRAAAAAEAGELDALIRRVDERIDRARGARELEVVACLSDQLTRARALRRHVDTLASGAHDGRKLVILAHRRRLVAWEAACCVSRRRGPGG